MSIRDEAIRSAAQALIQARDPLRNFQTNPYYAMEMGIARREATAAFDAIMERLKTPSQEMIMEGAAQCIRSANSYHPTAAIWQVMIGSVGEESPDYVMTPAPEGWGEGR